MITLKRFRKLEAILREAGYGPSIDWSETITPPIDADAFASEAIFVVVNSGFRNSTAVPIFERCMTALREGRSAASEFGHPGKSSAIDHIWANRNVLFAAYRVAPDQLDYLRQLPWIGPVTTYHLQKNLGGDHAKPDVHMERLARRDGTTTHKLCRRLAHATGYRVATVDSLLWRACQSGLLKSARYEAEGWSAAFQPKKFLKR
ncbi:MAG: hypothetical protein V4647_05615 [Pseudomonadota bacterium]